MNINKQAIAKQVFSLNVMGFKSITKYCIAISISEIFIMEKEFLFDVLSFAMKYCNANQGKPVKSFTNRPNTFCIKLVT